jgi:hypothetical protein
MTTAQDRLNAILPSWYELLTQWSLDGSLVAAATEALVLDSSNTKPDAKGQLQSLTSQWSAKNFKTLPEIVLLSDADISGAQGAFAASTGKIYLNADWLLTASEAWIQRVLTEEIGAYLDEQLSKIDTHGDEGALFSKELLGIRLSNAEKAMIQIEDDIIQIFADGLTIDAEASTATATANLSSILNLDFNGTSIQDTSTANNPITTTGTVLISNSQALFNGIDSSIQVNSAQGFAMDKDFKISVDITWDSQDDNYITTLIDKRQSGLGLGGWSLRLIDGTVFWEGVGTAIGGNYELSAPITRDVQHKIELSRVSGIVKLIIDGAEIASIYDPTDYTNSNPIKIANNQDFGPEYGSNYFKGMLDNISIVVGDIDNIGTATSDATPIIISGDLTAPSVESYATTTSGRGKNKTTVGAFTEITIDQSGPLDALVVNGGESNNFITGNGLADNISTAINETRSAFTGVLVIDGKGGADTITGGASGTNWLIGGGVSSVGTVDTLTGVALTTDIFDLRRNVADAWQDAYSVGNAVINGYDLGDYIVLAKDPNQYQVVNQTQTIERLNKRGKVIGVDTVTYFEIKDIAGDLIATVNGTSFTPSSSTADLKIVYGQNSQDPFEVVLPSTIPGTII